VKCPGNFDTGIQGVTALGGIGVSVRRGGAYFEFTGLEIGYAELCGLQIVDANLKGNNGKIDHCTIGVHIKNAPQNLNWSTIQTIIFADNERNLDADQLPFPDPSFNH
jgi:hypothetical protein